MDLEQAQKTLGGTFQWKHWCDPKKTNPIPARRWQADAAALPDF